MVTIECSGSDTAQWRVSVRQGMLRPETFFSFYETDNFFIDNTESGLDTDWMRGKRLGVVPAFLMQSSQQMTLQEL